MPRGRDDASSRNLPASSSISGSMSGLPFLKLFERNRFLATLRPTCSRSTASLSTSRTNLSTLDCIAGPAILGGDRGVLLLSLPSRLSLSLFSSSRLIRSSAHASERRGTASTQRSTSSATSSFRGIDPIVALAYFR